uniref:Uncharacterized protein n=1 Tax=Panagrolaimus sp. ES5 TaxID=591445 RepID=A0AC34FSM3_9BILA
MFHVWEVEVKKSSEDVEEKKSKYVGKWHANCSNLNELQNVVDKSELKKGPDIVLRVVKNENDEANLRRISPCEFFIYSFLLYDLANACLLKAQQNAGDDIFNHLDVEKILSQQIDLKIEGKALMSFKKGKKLPIFYSTHLIKMPNDKFLNIHKIYDSSDPDFCENESVQLPNYVEFELTYKIDINETHSMYFKNFLNENRYVIPQKDVSTELQVLGIDLGTSRCCAAVYRKSGIKTVALGNIGERLLPSYVSYDEKNVKCGQIVIHRLRNHSKSSIFDSKRIIGRHFNDVEIDESWNFAVIHENQKVLLEVDGFYGKKKVTAEEVASELLKHIKQKVEEFQGTNITKAVITIPSAVTISQKAATILAANLAGFNEVKLMLEPIAAAFAYFIDQPIPNNSTVLLFDLGGGTLDVCIFKVQNEMIQILSNTGDSKLGGRDFDAVLINYFKNLLNANFGISLLDEKKYKLMLECQIIKETLSLNSSTSLSIDEYNPSKEGIISITREEFERMAQNLLNKIRDIIQSALFISNLKSNEINQVLIVGGGSRMPMVKDLLRDMFSESEHLCKEHPDEVVGNGAAYFACQTFSGD